MVEMHINRKQIVTIVLMLLTIAAKAVDTCPMVKIEAERLADLNVARAGHNTLFLNGELTVLGGHSTGFVPTATAEYLKDGEWHLIPMAYMHDNGTAVALKNGMVLLAGGHTGNLGIGQTFETEIYNPVTHSFGNYGCMSQKRALASGTEIDSGRVVISGNWYGRDGVELFDNSSGFSYVKDVRVGRTSPYILRTASDDVLIFGSQGTCGQMLGDSTAIIDRLAGEPFMAPLLREWKPVNISMPPHNNAGGFIGDESTGDYSYLLLARDSVRYDCLPEQEGRSSGQTAIMLLRGTVFSLLPTVCPIPRETSVGGLIDWYGSVIADRHAQRAYVPGIDRDKRLYLLCVDYTMQPAPLTIYYTDPLPDCGFNMPVVIADGNLAIIGGNFQAGFHSTNYEPTATVWLIRLNENEKAATSTTLWPWVLIALLAAAIIAAVVYFHRRHHDTSTSLSSRGAATVSLFPRICQLMDEQQLFRNNTLKVSDVASALATNTRYVTECIKAERNQTFSQFVLDYRIAYAKQLLLEHPDKKITEVYTDAGFSNERSFFRAFKGATGMTTREWINQNS